MKNVGYYNVRVTMVTILLFDYMSDGIVQYFFHELHIYTICSILSKLLEVDRGSSLGLRNKTSVNSSSISSLHSLYLMGEFLFFCYIYFAYGAIK